jgi:hypothetical protein
VFTGVKQGDKTYTTAEWNKMMQSTPLKRRDVQGHLKASKPAQTNNSSLQ